MIPFPLLPDELQPKLNLPRSGSRARQLAEASRNYAIAVRVRAGENDAVAGIRRGEVRMVEDIEELDPELRVEAFGDRGLLEQREVEDLQARPGQHVPPFGPVETRRLKLERGRIHVAVGVACDRAVVAAARYHVRALRLPVVNPVARAV